MKINEIIDLLGGFGRYQWFAFLFLNCISFMGAFTTLQHVFYAAETDHWCTVFENNTCSQYGLNTDAECQDAVKNVSIPPTENYDPSVDYYYENCRQWNIPDGLEFSPDINRHDYVNGTNRIDCRNGEWTYDRSQYASTIIMEWNLVCELKAIPNRISSMYFLGFLVGSFVFSVISDWFGRKTAVIGAMLTWFVGALATPFVNSVGIFYVVRFVTGMGQLGRWIPSFVLVNEFVGEKWRVVTGILVAVSYSLGYMTVALVAMATRKWRTLAFIPVVPIFLTLFFVPFLYESVRWLLAKGKVEKAEEVIKKVAKWNKKKLPDVLFDDEDVQELQKALKGPTPSVLSLYRTPNMFFRSIDLQFNWMVNNMVYYGLSLSTNNLGPSDYWTFFIFGAVEIPALIYATFGVRWFGRKINMIVLELIGGSACLATVFIDDETIKLVVAMVGKFCITATLNILYLWTSELYPTSIRSTGVGMGSVIARLGSFLAPVLFNLNDLVPDIHLMVFGGATILGGVLLIPLPETKDKQLPETLAEGEEFGKCDCMRSWRWKGYDSETKFDQGIEMDIDRLEIDNPAYEEEDEPYSYEAKPPPYKAVSEKGCQFPAKHKLKNPTIGLDEKGKQECNSEKEK